MTMNGSVETIEQVGIDQISSENLGRLVLCFLEEIATRNGQTITEEIGDLLQAARENL